MKIMKTLKVLMYVSFAASFMSLLVALPPSFPNLERGEQNFFNLLSGVLMFLGVLSAVVYEYLKQIKKGTGEENEESIKEKVEEKSYSIEYFPNAEKPQIAVIVALEVTDENGNNQFYSTCGGIHCFLEAFKELSQRHEIRDITPVQSEICEASITKGLIVHIKPLE